MERKNKAITFNFSKKKLKKDGQTSFYIKKLENELSHKTDASILTQKSPSPIIVKHRHS